MAHALLTKLLPHTLQRTAQQPGADVRIIYLSSAGYKNAPPEGIAFPALATSMEDSPTFMRCGQSKAANMVYASELARRYPDIASVSCHPGIIDTELSSAYRSGNGFKGRALGLVLDLIGKSLAEWALNQLWCAMGNGVVSGRFYCPVGVENVGRGFPEDEELGKKLWDWTEEELNKKGYF